MKSKAIVETNFEGLDIVSRGKVRDIYKVGDDLLIVATDRISAFDVVLSDPIPGKGMVLNQLSLFWFDYFSEIVPNHLITADVSEMGDSVQPYAETLRGRSMLVRRAEVLPVECVVRGYLAGSGWKSYRESGDVCGIELPPGLTESAKLPEPIFTPTTKAERGHHDAPVSFVEMSRIVGPEVAENAKSLSIEVYSRAMDYAGERGLIICDTKFEWGFIDGGLSLVDEVLTPDSSRFWPADGYRPGGPQPSFDKQPVRDWLESTGWDKQSPPPKLTEEVIRKTSERYIQGFRLITGADPEL